MNDNKKSYLIMALILALWTIFFAGSCRPKVPSFSFAVLGDRTTAFTPGVFQGVVRQINRMHPDIVLSVGDAIEGYSSDEGILDEQWKEYMAIRDLVEAPYYHTAGNHDISPAHAGVMRSLYQKYLGESQYTFTFKNTSFVMFDTSLWETYADLPEDQWKWLEEALSKASDSENIVVFMHRPYWIEYVGSDKPDRMHDLFMKHHVSAVFAGHYHYYCSAEYDGILYTEMGSSVSSRTKDGSAISSTAP
jgi:3',5'-cyclic AMP phosphodiesterase CpdA